MKISSASKFFRVVLSTSCALALASSAVYAADKPAAPEADLNGIIRYKNTKEAAAQAQTDGKLIYVHFYLTGCLHCLDFKNLVLADSRVTVLQGEFINIWLNAENREGTQQADFYGIKECPAELFLDSSGEKIDLLSTDNAGEFSTTLAKMIQEHSEEKLVKKANTSTKDPWAATTLSVLYNVVDEPDKAKDYLKRANEMSLTTPAGKKNQRRLMLANLTMGDAQEKDGFYDWARPYYEQAAKLAVDPNDMISAKLEIANCFLFEKNKTSAVATLKEVLAVPEIDPAQKQLADQLMEKANKLRY